MLLPLLLSLSAEAATATAIPAWNWPVDQPVRFHVETEIITPRGVRYYASKNTDARAGSVKVRADTSCTAKPEGKVRVITCTFAYVDMKGVPWTPEEGAKLDLVMTEWTGDLARLKVELVQGPDGHVRGFDIGGMEGSNHRESYILENQRVLMQRLFCAFDLPITTDDKDWVRGWVQKGDVGIMQLQTISGTAGAVNMKHVHDGERNGLTVIETTARATLSAGAAVDAASGARLVDVRMAGETLFDASTGMLEWRDFSVDGQLTVSAQQAGGGAEFFQSLAIQRVDEFPAPGEIPLTVAALHAPKIDVVPPPPPAGVVMVTFGELGMAPLFVAGLPAAAKELGLPKSTVTARVFVGADGVPTSVKAARGYATLAAPTEEALMAARFPVRPAAYAVDVDVEWRP
jgi:hypothetical protein